MPTYTPPQNDVVNEYLAALPADLAPLFHEVRATILAAGPALNESIKWKNCLVYATSRNHIQTVVGKNKISLIFFEGVGLTDKLGLLEGDGSQARTFRITSAAYNKKALADYVKQTLKLAKGK